MKLPGGTATSYTGHSSKPGRVSLVRAHHPVFTGLTGLRLADSRALCCLGPTNLNSESVKSVSTRVQVYRKPRMEIGTEARDTEANTLILGCMVITHCHSYLPSQGSPDQENYFCSYLEDKSSVCPLPGR